MLWIDLVNSLANDPLGQDPPQDRLERAEWRSKFLRDNGFRPDAVESEADLTALMRLRGVLGEVAMSIVDDERPTDAQIEALNGFLAGSTLRASVGKADDGFEVRLAPAGSGTADVLLAIASSCARFLAEEDLSRLRRCENEDCRWVFYDRSRSRTRRWCADSCGNLIKVRRFRERHAGEDG